MNYFDILVHSVCKRNHFIDTRWSFLPPSVINSSVRHWSAWSSWVVQSKMAVASDLPTELVARPLSLVALSGLDIAANTAHKKIWESFTLNRQPDRISLAFTLVPHDHQFPKCKAKVLKNVLVFSLRQNSMIWPSWGLFPGGNLACYAHSVKWAWHNSLIASSKQSVLRTYILFREQITTGICQKAFWKPNGCINI